MKQVKLIPILFCYFLFIAGQVMAGEIAVIDPWIREAPPGTEMLAAYMTIENQSNHTATLVSVSSPAFSMIHIHLTKMDNGMAHMQKQSDLQIKVGGSVVLAPGGYHLMLMQPVRSLHAGDKVKLQLHFDDTEAIDVTAVVRKR